MAIPDSVQQKLYHARLHFEACKAEMAGYFDSKPCRLVRDAESSVDNPTFTLRVTEPVPARLTLLMGDCLQNLRSSLDYLVWELVLAAKNQQPSKDNMFPICITPEGFKKALNGRRLEGVNSTAADLIGWFQPHRAGGKSDAEGMPLGGWPTSKHLHHPPTRVPAGGPYLSIFIILQHGAPHLGFFEMWVRRMSAVNPIPSVIIILRAGCPIHTQLHRGWVGF
jgi:hypothetical protein